VSRYLRCIHDSWIGDIEYGKTSGAKDDLGKLFVSGSCARGIYATLPQPAGAGHGRFAKHQNTDGLLYDRPATGGLNSGVNPSTLSDSE
jgi:hypothetical protein